MDSDLVSVPKHSSMYIYDQTSASDDGALHVCNAQLAVLVHDVSSSGLYHFPARISQCTCT